MTLQTWGLFFLNSNILTLIYESELYNDVDTI